ncbi:phage tail sheath subtilisin-like domain-containing protein [Enterobacter bugandensis]|nr:phage tail sheath subtilisin-like domain-containing protein [Enterobacter bugandensis]
MKLHGTRTREVDNAPLAITTVNMSVIGLVGTAPDAISGVAATITTGSTITDTAINFTAVQTGFDGNQLSVAAVPGSPDITDPLNPLPSDTTAEMDGNLLTITLGTDETGVVNATALDVEAAVTVLASTLISAEVYPGTAGEGVVEPFAAINLQGGENEPFPLYTPSIIAGSQTQADKLGTTGSLPDDMADILAQTGALTIVVRVEPSENVDTQRANIMKGIVALEMAQGTLNYQPRILIAPEWSTDDGVGKQLESTAIKLRAVTYLDSLPMSPPEAVARRRQIYGPRVEMLRPRIMVADSDTGVIASRPYSAAAAGHRVRIDAQFGWWWSKSNQPVYGFVGLEQVDSFIIGDELCMANQLNQVNVSTIVMMDGYRHWGNRLCTDHPKMRFEAVRRTMDAIQDSIQITVTKNFNDRPIDKALTIALLGSIDSYIRQETERGSINGGSVWLDPELNTPESLDAGEIYVNVTISAKSPAEEITITYSLDSSRVFRELAIAA